MENRITKSVGKILKFPVVKIIIGIVLINVGVFFFRNIGQLILSPLHIKNELLYNIVLYSIRIISLIYLYKLFIWIYEKRKTSEIDFNKNSFNRVAFGILIGILCIGFILGVNYLFGWISIIKVNESPDIIQGFFYTVFFALLQDFIYFLIIFRITEKYLGTYLSILITGLIFGFKHLLFPEYLIINGFFIFLDSLFIFSALYLRSRTVWEIFGFHLTYNFIQVIVLGISIPEKMQSVFELDINGPMLFTGDKSGLESSLPVALFCVIVGGFIFLKEKNKGEFKNPYWKK
ncbi:MAG: hypothetical protein JXR31_05740 [Prolixibacteraceae bacterium]|nr:hypothetical protein [Prolixibacteraceae bacterium]MBN2773730.1 hypothetical protein [Prolixibacteraceae bacterium]